MYLAFDIGGSSIKYGLVTAEGEILEKSKIPTENNEEKFLKNFSSLIEDFKKRYPQIEGIGISAPGIVSKEGVMTTFGALDKMHGFPLQETISKLSGLEVSVINDGNAAAISEKWLGAAKSMDNYIVMVLGTGVGGGIVINGQVYQGSHGMAAELGWPLYHGITKSGDIERQSENFHSAILTGLLRRYHSQRDIFGKEEFLDDAAIFLEKVQEKDKLAVAVFKDYIQDLALNLLNLFAIFDPEAILIAGGISENRFFMESLEEAYQKLVESHGTLRFVNDLSLLGHIKSAQLKNDAGLLGATYVIQQKIKGLF
ncbi:MAG: ROK family protein [Lactovum sp.]